MTRDEMVASDDGMPEPGRPDREPHANTEASEGRVRVATRGPNRVALRVSQWRGPTTRSEFVILTPAEARVVAHNLTRAADESQARA